MMVPKKNTVVFYKDLVKVHRIPSSEIMQQEKRNQQEESSVADECKNEQWCATEEGEMADDDASMLER